MATMKDSIFNIESKRDINCVRLSYRVYNRLTKDQKSEFWAWFKEMPNSDVIHGKIRPCAWLIADMALYIYAKSRKTLYLPAAFRMAKKRYKELWDQLNQQVLDTKNFMLSSKRDKFIAKQFLFHGFEPLAYARDIDIEDSSAAYITSSRSFNGITYIFPKKLHMNHKMGSMNPNERFLWYQFEGGAPVPGYTRCWYPQELKYLRQLQIRQLQNAQRT